MLMLEEPFREGTKGHTLVYLHSRNQSAQPPLASLQGIGGLGSCQGAGKAEKEGGGRGVDMIHLQEDPVFALPSQDFPV